MHDMTTTVRLDDLEKLCWYEVVFPIGVAPFDDDDEAPSKLQFLGFVDLMAVLRPEGSRTCVYIATRLLAASTITQVARPVEIIEPGYEPIAEARERLDAADNQEVPPWPHRDLRILLGLLAASLAGWIALFLYAFPFGR